MARYYTSERNRRTRRQRSGGALAPPAGEPSGGRGAGKAPSRMAPPKPKPKAQKPKKKPPQAKPNRPRSQPRNRPNRPRPRSRYDPLAPLQGRGFRRELNALVGSQFAPLENELASQRDAAGRIFGQTQANLGSWYDNYLAQVAQATQATQQAYGQAQAGVATQANQARVMDEQAAAQQQQQSQQQAAVSGATPDPQVNEDAMLAAAARQALGSSFAGLLGTLGANATGYMADQGRIGAGAKLGALQQAQGQYQGQLGELGRMGTDLAREKGQYRYKARGELSDRERTYELNRQAFGLNVAEAQAEQRDERADRRLERRKMKALERDRRADRRLARRSEGRLQRGEERQQRNTESLIRERNEPDKDGDGDGGSKFTPTQRRAGREKFRNLVHRYRNNVDPPESVDPLLARAAVQMAERGGVSPDLARKIRRNYGFMPKVKRLGAGGFEERRSGRRGGEQFTGLS